MEIKIIGKKENPLLLRTELSGEIGFTGATPSNAELQKFIAAKLNVDSSVVKVKNIYTSFGETKASFEANIYQSKEQLEKLEPVGRKAKEKLAKAAGGAEAPKEESSKEEKSGK